MEYTVYIRIHRKSHEEISEFHICGEHAEILEKLVEQCDEAIQEDLDYLEEREG